MAIILLTDPADKGKPPADKGKTLALIGQFTGLTACHAKDLQPVMHKNMHGGFLEVQSVPVMLEFDFWPVTGKSTPVSTPISPVSTPGNPPVSYQDTYWNTDWPNENRTLLVLPVN